MDKKKVRIIVRIITFVIVLIVLGRGFNTQNEENVLNEVENVESTINKVLQVTSENFEQEVLNSETPVIVDFYADWCVPCRMLSSTLKAIANENENIKVVRIDVDNEEKLATEYKIMSLPTLVVIKNGEEVNRIVGVQSKEQILSMLQ